jgi:hypothetical protein
MLRATQLALQAEIATRFGLTTTDTVDGTSTYRDVVWGPPDVAFRLRSEQSSKLGRNPESIFPFASFWRTGYRANMQRLNTMLAESGASTDSNLTQKYKMKPLDLAFQVEYWSYKPGEYEAAIENWYKWKLPGNILELTDVNDITFEMNLVLGDAQDNSRLQEQFEIGKIYRATFPVAVGSFVIEDGGTFVTIETIFWTFNDYSATDDVDDAVLIKSGSITG